MVAQHPLDTYDLDPTIRAEYSVLEVWARDVMAPIRDKCCCPTFIVAGTGPVLTVMGAVFTNRFIVQRLTSLTWLGEAATFEDSHVYELSRALRRSVDQLENYHRTLQVPELSPRLPHPRYFPYSTRFMDPQGPVVEFKYVRALTDAPESEVVVLAETVCISGVSYKHDLVVRFVDRYCGAAHQLLASHGLAPALHYFGLLDGQKAADDADDGLRHALYVGPLRMVVMDYVKGTEASGLATDPLTDDVVDQPKRALDILHNDGYVFGDMRPSNALLLDAGRVHLIDFSWAGKQGDARYP
ncbi:hypothetical protein EUX98_g7638 [Antrodiella citrinella]|uniref:Protein kinase domain-containing protein n=1 Tax=Antrodiella citrinella TaxID=2447956 RepID=A0A4S4MLC3_9APHY|nr:hypothetical protein EUX98_g7638 [Antrodiella citrinella]